MIKITFAPDGGVTIGMEGDMPFDQAAQVVEAIKVALAGLVALNALAFEGGIEQHRHDGEHVHVHAHRHQ